MNELEFLRSQLRLEQNHLDRSRDLLQRALRLGAADAAARAARQAALAHLQFALRRSTERGHVHVQLVSGRTATGYSGAAERRAVLDAVAALQAALATAEPALQRVAFAATTASPHDGDDPLRAAATAAQQLADGIGHATEMLEPWFARLYDLSDWRRAARIDAEAVFDERRLYDAAVEAARTAGILE